ncbi:YktB family protein [Paenibacillus hamazuiensis]|uniref:YktB family protein n=1 Tax=Paenibacillus hamazuiensis TaxID=2936508 RepID=UPI00200D5CC2|nr:DUF1054 domain-containing protein [Paenibacillus hamazuiensis]
MAFSGFSPHDFATFSIEGLEPRMKAIQERIQPKFKELGEELGATVSALAGHEMFLHIAKHARRKVNPPVDTWMAFASNKRGYKQFPHFQVGLFDDRLFIWLALIYELPAKTNIGKTYLKHIDELRQTIPGSYMLSFDHMKKDAVSAADLSKKELKAALEKFRDVKKTELLIGKVMMADEPLISDGPKLTAEIAAVFETLSPLYRLAMQVQP